jgi:peptide/nickel transport system permease protein
MTMGGGQAAADAAAVAEEVDWGTRPRGQAFGRFKRNRPALVGAIVIAVFGILALFAPLIAPRDPLLMESGIRLTSPDGSHLLGTDEFGRDILSRLLYGARISFLVGFAATGAAALLGTPLGLVAGYYRGWYDRVGAAIIDVLFSFPSILLAIAVVAIMGPGLRNVIVAIGFTMTPHFARLVRGATMAIRNEQYVEAAQAIGASNFRVVLRHILPNIAAPMIVQASLVFSFSITAEASLSFLGVGNQPPTPSWGLMLQGAYGYVNQAPTAAIFPGLAITTLVLSFNVVGDGLRDFFNPAQR